jgi:hypothetical protein
MSDYSDTQFTRNAEYRNAYAEWVASLTPKKRRELEAQGLLEAQVDPFHLGRPKDISDLPLAAEDQEAEEIQQEESDRIWEVLRRLLGDLLSSPNTQLSLECLAIVSGVGFMGDSMTAIAKRHGVTRAAVSKRCVQITEQLNLMPSRAMKSLTARKAYRTAQRKHYEHRERFDDGRRTRPSD